MKIVIGSGVVKSAAGWLDTNPEYELNIVSAVDARVIPDATVDAFLAE